MVIIAGNFSLNFGHISGVKLESCILEMSHIKAFEFSRSILGTITNGASGYLLKDISGVKLAESIRDAVQGGG